ncbi:RNA polymerase sigma factor [Arthrobacter saudimassiliensis]|uniref:RNA polymerase sigma factor n=1 Tax=Arthrobacter saudimassiliensis TaxID=1461584 RepID=A0A078MKU9_9MICC|nr:RNA polymerase sigma factor [Arthrobacter saudimassiliensis]
MPLEPSSGERAIQSVSTGTAKSFASLGTTPFGELYDRQGSALYRYAARRARGFAADDVIAKTLLIAWERLESYDLNHGDAGPWLFGIDTNLLRRHHRSEAGMMKAAARSAARDSVADESERINAQTDAVVATGFIELALNRMPAIDRDILLLYAWGDLTYESMATAMDVPVTGVRRFTEPGQGSPDLCLLMSEDAGLGRSPAKAITDFWSV